MARTPKAYAAKRAALANEELRLRFPAVHDAAMAWQDTGEVERLDQAFEALENDPKRYSLLPIEAGRTRDERILALTKRYVTVSRVAGRVQTLAAELDAEQANIRAELTAELAKGDEIAAYQRQLLKGLEAVGIGLVDLHPVSINLARALGTTVRDYQAARRAKAAEQGEDDADQLPLESWADLPRSFAGYELVDVAPEDIKFRDVYPLPPATDIAEFTPDGSRPEPLGTHRGTVIAWLSLIEAWSKSHAIKLDGMQSACWAMLLAHRMADDTSRIKNLEGLYVVSPWEAGRVVRIVMLPPPNSSEIEA